VSSAEKAVRSRSVVVSTPNTHISCLEFWISWWFCNSVVRVGCSFEWVLILVFCCCRRSSRPVSKLPGWVEWIDHQRIMQPTQRYHIARLFNYLCTQILFGCHSSFIICTSGTLNLKWFRVLKYPQILVICLLKSWYMQKYQNTGQSHNFDTEFHRLSFANTKQDVCFTHCLRQP
jgi:hypothetical protein